MILPCFSPWLLFPPALYFSRPFWYNNAIKHGKKGSFFMKNNTIKTAVAALGLTLFFTNAAPALALHEIGDTSKLIISYTFDDPKEQYTLMEGASLTDGPDGKALLLDNTKKQYVHLPDDLTTALTGDYSISVDLCPSSEDSWARVFDIATGSDNTMFLTTYGGGIPKFKFKGDALESNGINFKVGQWNNAVITRQGKEGRMYINGVLAATSNAMNNDLSAIGSTDQNFLGKSQYPADAYYNGMIDNFQIYNYALSERDVRLGVYEGIEIEADYQDKDGNALITFQEGADTLSSVVSIKNYKLPSLKASVFHAVYNGEGALIDVSLSAPSVVSLGDTAAIKTQLTTRSEAAKIITSVYTEEYGMQVISRLEKSSLTFPGRAPEDSDTTTAGVHDPAIFKDPVSGIYYAYSTGMIDIFKSEDLIHWTRTQNTLPQLPQCILDSYPHETLSEYSNIWAPDMMYNKDDKEYPYYLYCSYSDAFGKNSSSLVLLKGKTPEGPWENAEIVFSTVQEGEELSLANAIDSNIATDAKTGEKYMVYGSFWRGIHLKPLNKDGKVDDTATLGTRLMSRYKGAGGPEGAWIIYNPDTDYYYLFASYDDLSSTYNIRVARSKGITGPYVDQNGNSVDRFFDDEAEAGNTYGYKLAGSYQFPNETTYYGPGHNSVLKDDDGSWYLIHHTREVKGSFAYLHVRTMLWNEEGWPVVSPERYAGEKLQEIPENLLIGDWDYISIGDNTNNMMQAEKLTLLPGGQLAEDKGSWSFDGNYTLTLKLKNNETVTVYVMAVWDRDAEKANLVFTGTNQDNVQKWAKKAIGSLVYE